MKIPFGKPWCSVADQVAHLERRGLIIEDKPSAEAFLRHLNYYRFSGYALAFESTRHAFRPETTFEDIRKTYEFDRTLRDLIYESMEVIELDVRTTVAYTYGRTYDAFGHIDDQNFHHRFNHPEWTRRLRQQTNESREPFIKHFKQTYTEYPDLPIWVVTEIMSFGTLSRMVQSMLKKDQKAVASRYGLQPANFTSCLHHLVYVRNICAHHARLWDREWSIKPDLPHGKVWQAPLLPANDRLFASLLVQNTLLKGCQAEREFTDNWRARVQELIHVQTPKCPEPLKRMGFTEKWHQHPLWS